MPLTIDNPELEKLVDELVALTGERQVEVLRQALLERRANLQQNAPASKKTRLLKFLKEEVWPQIPDEVLGKGISQQEQDDLLSYGPEGI